MLPLLLMLIQDPATPPVAVSAHDPGTRLRVTVRGCPDDGFRRIEETAGGAADLRPDLTYRPDDGEVRHYLLLDRRVRGCAAPISYPLPARQDGFIRELGRTPPPVRIQPPRSSE